MFLFSSCSSDDNSTIVEPQTVNHLLGAWKLNTMSIKISQDGQVISEQIDAPIGNQLTWEYKFNEDLSVEYYIDTENFSENSAGTYSLNGSYITIVLDGEPETFEITTLDKDNLHLKFNVEEEVEPGSILEMEMEQKFIRQ